MTRQRQETTNKTGGRFPLAIFDHVNFTDGSVSVKFKAVKGSSKPWSQPPTYTPAT